MGRKRECHGWESKRKGMERGERVRGRKIEERDRGAG
jgi:hypothetical protein